MKRTMKMMLVAMLTTVCCTHVAAQGVNVGDSKNMIRIDGIIPVTNINMTQGPKLLSDNSVEFTVRAPEAQKVQVDIGGTKYDMTKGDGGMWTVKTKPQVPGFHYYSLIIDGVSVADPFVSCGEQDPRIEYTRNIVKKMRDGGVEVKFNSYPGDHEWQVWRKSLHEFAQYLFR